jgi:DNA polymerase-3 subunit alpha
VVQGKASLDEYSGNVRVGGEELFNFAQARSHFARHLLLNCSGNPGVAQLMEILKPWSEGECRVLIQYSNGVASCQLRLGEVWQVTLADELLHDLSRALQPENVRVVYG